MKIKNIFIYYINKFYNIFFLFYYLKVKKKNKTLLIY